MVIWLIGMSGSGKTTLAEALRDRLKPAHPNLVLLDGDVFREVFRGADHTVEGRRANAERISHLCRMLDAQGIHVIAAVLSIFPKWQRWNRENFSAYYEVFLDLPMAVLRRRDVKGLYAAADAGEMTNVVGIDIPFPAPAGPDLVLNADDQEAGVAACVTHILRNLPPLADEEAWETR
jgi:adenylylsulfate kinase